MDAAIRWMLGCTRSLVTFCRRHFVEELCGIGRHSAAPILPSLSLWHEIDQHTPRTCTTVTRTHDLHKGFALEGTLRNGLEQASQSTHLPVIDIDQYGVVARHACGLLSTA